MKAKHEKLGLLLALALGASTESRGAILYDNLPPSLADVGMYLEGLSLFNTGYLASQFSTNTSACAFGCTLGDITLTLYSAQLFNRDGETAGYQLQIFSDIGNAPGVSLLSMHNPSRFSNQVANHVFSPNGVLSLAPNSNYWVKLAALGTDAASGRTLAWSAYQLATQAVAGQPARFMYEVFQGSPVIFSNPKFLMKVETTTASASSPVPVPGALGLIGSALIGLLPATRRKSLEHPGRFQC
jgi:hypothetical protein